MVVMVMVEYTKGRVKTILLELTNVLKGFVNNFVVCVILVYKYKRIDHLMLYYNEHRAYIANIIYHLITGHRVDNVRHTSSIKRKYCRND